MAGQVTLPTENSGWQERTQIMADTKGKTEQKKPIKTITGQ